MFQLGSPRPLPSDTLHWFFALPCYMAALARSAALPDRTGRNLSDRDWGDYYNHVENSLSLVRKIIQGVPQTHRACITAETFDLNSDKGTFALVAEKIQIPVFPVLQVLSATRDTLESNLVQMLKGVVLHQAMLSSLSSHLGPQDTVTELLADTRDLLIQIRMLLKTIQKDAAEQPAAPVLDLKLSGDFDVQVATHVTLQHMQHFGQDMERILRGVSRANEDVTNEPTTPEQS
ncbi:unnamed protein product [Merluccius merluccius]